MSLQGYTEQELHEELRKRSNTEKGQILEDIRCLDRKIVKLNVAFMHKSFKELHKDDKAILRKQRLAMKKYSEALLERYRKLKT